MRNRVKSLHRRYYVSNDLWLDGTSQFGFLVRSYLRPDMKILNLGAGPGTGKLHFDRMVGSVIGLDPACAIERNEHVTFRVRGVAETLPFRSDTFDLVYMDWVIEHLSFPRHAVAEVFRVLQPRGKFIFRTGNLFHYSYLIASVTPHWFHTLLVGHHDADPYPTFYRMNTVRAIRRILAAVGFKQDRIVMMEPDPAYVTMSRLTFLGGVLYERLVNRFDALKPLRANILACFVKPERRWLEDAISNPYVVKLEHAYR